MININNLPEGLGDESQKDESEIESEENKSKENKSQKEELEDKLKDLNKREQEILEEKRQLEEEIRNKSTIIETLGIEINLIRQQKKEIKRKLAGLTSGGGTNSIE